MPNGSARRRSRPQPHSLPPFARGRRVLMGGRAQYAVAP